MIKYLHHTIWCFDAEWVPDPIAGRIVYNMPDSMSDAEVVARMYTAAGATPENPRPYLKTALCQIVSIAVLQRTMTRDGIAFRLRSLPTPDGERMTEYEIIDAFLSGVGEKKPQLVSFNGADADMPAILQRALAQGVSAPAFCSRPLRPWEGVDYFAPKLSDWHVDMKNVVSGFGKSTPSQDELAGACGIPGKIFDVDGSTVADLFFAGDMSKVARYNQLDVLTLYELFARLLLLSGKLSRDAFTADSVAFVKFLEQQEQAHIVAYLASRAALRQYRRPFAPVADQPVTP